MDPSTTYSNTPSSAFGPLGGSIFLVVCLFYVAIIALFVLVYWKLFSKAGYSGWLSLLMFVPVVNIVMILFLAFADWPVLRENRDLKAKLNAPAWPAAGAAAAPVATQPVAPPVAPQPATAPPVAPQPQQPSTGAWPETKPAEPAPPAPPAAPAPAPAAPVEPAAVPPAPPVEPAATPPAPPAAEPAPPAPPAAPEPPADTNPPAPPAPPAAPGT